MREKLVELAAGAGALGTFFVGILMTVGTLAKGGSHNYFQLGLIFIWMICMICTVYYYSRIEKENRQLHIKLFKRTKSFSTPFDDED